MTRRGLAAICLVVFAMLPSMAAAQAGRILVMPFDNVARDGKIVWLGEATSVVLADDLSALGADAISRDEREKAFEQLQVAEAPSLTDATMIRIGQVVGAAQVVVGTIKLEGNDLVVQARAIALDSARVQSRVTDRAPITDLFALSARVAQRLLPAAASPAAPRPHPPVAAFENYIKGLLADAPSTAVGYFTAALQVAPDFDRARLALWTVYDDLGDHAKALAAVTPILNTSPFAWPARFRTGLSQIYLQKYGDAFTTFKSLTEAQPNPGALNNLGVIQLRRGATPATGTPIYYFHKATEADPSSADYCFNLGYAYFLERDAAASTYWLREAVRRDVADGDAHYVLGTVLGWGGNTSESAREKELARRLSSAYADWDKRPAGDPIPKGLERIKDGVELPRARRLEESLSAGQRDQQELARFYLDRGRRLYEQQQDRDALNELNRVVFLSPYQAEANLLIGRIHLRGGRLRDAVDALKISIWSLDSADAHAALAEAYLASRDDAGARTEAERALSLNPSSAAARLVLDRLAAR